MYRNYGDGGALRTLAQPPDIPTNTSKQVQWNGIKEIKIKTTLSFQRVQKINKSFSKPSYLMFNLFIRNGSSNKTVAIPKKWPSIYMQVRTDIASE